MPEDKVRKIELPRLDPTEVMLLVVDMQNDFCHPNGARAKAFGVDAIAMPRASIPAVVEMIRVARAGGARVTYTRQEHYPDDQARKPFRLKFEWVGSSKECSVREQRMTVAAATVSPLR